MDILTVACEPVTYDTVPKFCDWSPPLSFFLNLDATSYDVSEHEGSGGTLDSLNVSLSDTSSLSGDINKERDAIIDDTQKENCHEDDEERQKQCTLATTEGVGKTDVIKTTPSGETDDLIDLANNPDEQGVQEQQLPDEESKFVKDIVVAAETIEAKSNVNVVFIADNNNVKEKMFRSASDLRDDSSDVVEKCREFYLKRVASADNILNGAKVDQDVAAAGDVVGNCGVSSSATELVQGSKTKDPCDITDKLTNLRKELHSLAVQDNELFRQLLNLYDSMRELRNSQELHKKSLIHKRRAHARSTSSEEEDCYSSCDEPSTILSDDESHHNSMFASPISSSPSSFVYSASPSTPTTVSVQRNNSSASSSSSTSWRHFNMASPSRPEDDFEERCTDSYEASSFEDTGADEDEVSISATSATLPRTRSPGCEHRGFKGIMSHSLPRRVPHHYVQSSFDSMSDGNTCNTLPLNRGMVLTDADGRVCGPTAGSTCCRRCFKQRHRSSKKCRSTSGIVFLRRKKAFMASGHCGATSNHNSSSDSGLGSKTCHSESDHEIFV